MQPQLTDLALEDLSTLLDAEREALLGGDLERLADMYSAKEALIGSVTEHPEKHDLRTLEALDRKVRRNQLLLDGALEGIREVARRMAALRETRGSLETYGADGRKHRIEMDAEASVEKRA
jgi:flagellar biosynthesis/type III secretory pathway chaperone